MKKILLISGGLDSTYVYFLRKEIIDECIYFDYGQPFLENEEAVLKNLGITYKKVKIDTLKKIEKDKHYSSFFYARNMKFVQTVRDMYPEEHLCILMGSNLEDNFHDNSPIFMQDLTRVLNASYPSKVKIIQPLQYLGKKEIARGLKAYLKDNKVYWCHKGTIPQCGECVSCMTMKDLNLFEDWK